MLVQINLFRGRRLKNILADFTSLLIFLKMSKICVHTHEEFKRFVVVQLEIFLDFLFLLFVFSMTATALFFFDAVTAMAFTSCSLILLPDFILILHMML